MNKWLVLGTGGNTECIFWITRQRPFPCPSKCYRLNYKLFSPMVERALIFITISWAIPSPRVFKPWTRRTKRSSSSSWRSGLPPSTRSAGNGERLPEQHALYCQTKGTSQLCWPSPWANTYIWQKASYEHSNDNNGPATRKDCAVYANSHWERFRVNNHGMAAKSHWWHGSR